MGGGGWVELANRKVIAVWASTPALTAPVQHIGFTQQIPIRGIGEAAGGPKAAGQITWLKLPHPAPPPLSRC